MNIVQINLDPCPYCGGKTIGEVLDNRIVTCNWCGWILSEDQKKQLLEVIADERLSSNSD